MAMQNIGISGRSKGRAAPAGMVRLLAHERLPLAN
jgi:hypothetical protein